MGSEEFTLILILGEQLSAAQVSALLSSRDFAGDSWFGTEDHFHFAQVSWGANSHEQAVAEASQAIKRLIGVDVVESLTPEEWVQRIQPHLAG